MQKPNLNPYGTCALSNGLQLAKRAEWSGKGAPDWNRVLEGLALLGQEPDLLYAAALIAARATAPCWELTLLLLCERVAAAEGATLLALDAATLRTHGSTLNLSEREITAWLKRLPALLLSETQLFSSAADQLRGRASELDGEEWPLLAPFVLDQEAEALYRRAFWVAETQIVRALQRLSAQSWRTVDALDACWHEIQEVYPLKSAKPETEKKGYTQLKKDEFRFAAAQEAAIRVAAAAPLTIISGGPGTGKTSTVIGILRILTRLGKDPERIFLAAPTGRAANRLAEAIQTSLASIEAAGREGALARLPEPRTIHRLLGSLGSSDHFRHGPDNPLACDTLIVDECSMLSLSLFERLLGALPPDASLVLLGDADQLPSVDAGAVFRDLIRAAESQAAIADGRERPSGLARSCVRLEIAFRQRSGMQRSRILALAAQVNAGQGLVIDQADPLQPHLPGMEPEPNCFVHTDATPVFQANSVTLVDAQVPRERLIERIFQDHWGILRELSERVFRQSDLETSVLTPYFEAFHNLRVLAITRQGPGGTEGLNQEFRKHFSPNRGQLYLPGTPWMVVRNDYRAQLFNGDIGLCIQFREGQELRDFLVFQGGEGFRRFHVEQVPGLVPAYAMTVHKAQGGEAENVLLVLPERQHPLCSKELIYTALTRAKNAVMIYGSAEVLDYSARQALVRATRLRERLADSEIC